MKLIDADTKVTIEVYDDEHEEYNQERTTIADALDRWTKEGCPPEVISQEAQGARLVTEEDFRSPLADDGTAIPCWKESRSPTRRSGWAVIVYGKWLADKPYARYWTSRPTDEQRRDTPWQ